MFGPETSLRCSWHEYCLKYRQQYDAFLFTRSLMDACPCVALGRLLGSGRGRWPYMAPLPLGQSTARPPVSRKSISKEHPSEDQTENTDRMRPGHWGQNLRNEETAQNKWHTHTHTQPDWEMCLINDNSKEHVSLLFHSHLWLIIDIAWAVSLKIPEKI